MNEVLNTLLAWENDSRLRDPLQEKNQKLRNTRICNCFIVLVCTHMDVTLYLGGRVFVFDPIVRQSPIVRVAYKESSEPKARAL